MEALSMLHIAEDTSLQTQLDTELALVHATQQGDIQAYQQLYTLHVNKVYSLAYRLTGDHGMAEDATQEVFIQLWQKIAGFAGNSRFSTWLYSVASNVTITYMRKQKSWLQRVFSQETVIVPELSSHDSTVSLDELIIKLPEQARIVFVLHAIEGRRHEDIATTLKIATGTSKAQFHRAKTLLQEWMNDAE
jgi:RNA polymerase sigma-70 factor (ECF subfamily)